MPKPSKKRVKRQEAESVEVEPDAWERFESAVNKVATPKRGNSKKDKAESAD